MRCSIDKIPHVDLISMMSNYLPIYLIPGAVTLEGFLTG